MPAILARLREPSTYAGLGVLLGLFGVNLVPEAMQSIVSLGTGAAGLAAVVLAERKR